MTDRPTCQCKTPIPAGSLFCWSHDGRHPVAMIAAEQGHVRWHTLDAACIGRAERLLAVTVDGVQVVVVAADAEPRARPERLELLIREVGRLTAKPELISLKLVKLFDAIQSGAEHVDVPRSVAAL